MAEMSENMKQIMAKVRKHIMTGNSANTPAFDLRSTKKPAETKKAEEEKPAKPKGPKASSFKLPDYENGD